MNGEGSATCRCDLCVANRRVRELEAEAAELRAAMKAAFEAWRAQAGRVFESMGNVNPRAVALEQAMDALLAAAQPPQPSTSRSRP